jgi:hypothetical protein
LRARALEILLGQKKNFVPNLVFFGSQEAVKKIWSKIWIFHGSKVVERGKYSLLSGVLTLVHPKFHMAWSGFDLERNHYQLWITKNYGNGHQTLEFELSANRIDVFTVFKMFVLKCFVLKCLLLKYIILVPRL